MNAMLWCISGEIFLGSIDTTGKYKDVEHVVANMIKCIDVVGPRMLYKFAQIIEPTCIWLGI
jgi:hypothetical protein